MAPEGGPEALKKAWATREARRASAATIRKALVHEKAAAAEVGEALAAIE